MKKPGRSMSVEKTLPRPSSAVTALPWSMKPSPAPTKAGMHDPVDSLRKWLNSVPDRLTSATSNSDPDRIHTCV